MRDKRTTYKSINDYCWEPARLRETTSEGLRKGPQVWVMLPDPRKKRLKDTSAEGSEGALWTPVQLPRGANFDRSIARSLGALSSSGSTTEA